MNAFTIASILLLVISWPLLLAMGMAFGATRPISLKLLPWAVLPGLATAILLADTEFQLPGLMLGSELVLDDTGRIFLLLNAGLWLATGLIARSQRYTVDTRRDVIMLLAMTGGFGMALAGDALLFFAAATLTGYALYGLLARDTGASSQRARRILVGLLVISDLMVFELLLMLGHTAGSVDFMSLRQAFMNTDNQELILGLAIIGFGVKAGVVGFHFWLAPVFMTTALAIRPALIGFVLSAGLLGWLRLLPLGEAHWVVASNALQWLVWITLGYAVLAGLLQQHFRSLLASATLVLTGLWLALLGTVLEQPQAWHEITTAVHTAILQSAFALAALLILSPRTIKTLPARLHRLSTAAMWLAALLLITTPIYIAGSLARIDSTAALPMHWVTAVITFLVVRALLLVTASSHSGSYMNTSLPQASQTATPTILLVSVGLIAAASLAASYSLIRLVYADIWPIVLVTPAAAAAAWLSASRYMSYQPVLVPAYLLTLISNVPSLVIGHSRRLTNEKLPRLHDAWLAALKQRWSNTSKRLKIEQIESGLRRWHTALTILLLLGLIVAFGGGSKNG